MRPVWGMKEADRPILRILDESGLALRSSSIRYNLSSRYDIDIPESTFYRRLKHLTHSGLVEQEEESYYSVSELGKRLLSEELSDEEVAEVSQRLKEGPSDS